MADEKHVPTFDVQYTWESETYGPLNPDAKLAQEIFDKGLIFLINQNVLHHYGYAIGVTVDDDGRVGDLSLFKTSDPDGVWFGEDTLVVGRKKLAEAGLR